MMIFFKIATIDETLDLAVLAYYYCAVPRMSAGITRVLQFSSWQLGIIYQKCSREPRAADTLFAIGAKLRCRNLVRMGRIILAGRFRSEERLYFWDLSDKQLRRCMNGMMASIERKIVAANIALIRRAHFDQELKTELLMDVEFKDDIVFLPCWLRAIYEGVTDKYRRDKKRDDKQLVKILEGLLADNIPFQLWKNEVESNQCKEIFLCAELLDNDLPWDVD